MRQNRPIVPLIFLFLCFFSSIASASPLFSSIGKWAVGAVTSSLPSVLQVPAVRLLTPYLTLPINVQCDALMQLSRICVQGDEEEEDIHDACHGAMALIPHISRKASCMHQVLYMTVESHEFHRSRLLLRTLLLSGDDWPHRPLLFAIYIASMEARPAPPMNPFRESSGLSPVSHVETMNMLVNHLSEDIDDEDLCVSGLRKVFKSHSTYVTGLSRDEKLEILFQRSFNLNDENDESNPIMEAVQNCRSLYLAACKLARNNSIFWSNESNYVGNFYYTVSWSALKSVNENVLHDGLTFDDDFDDIQAEMKVDLDDEEFDGDNEYESETGSHCDDGCDFDEEVVTTKQIIDLPEDFDTTRRSSVQFSNELTMRTFRRKLGSIEEEPEWPVTLGLLDLNDRFLP